MWADHDQLKRVGVSHPVGEEVLRGVDLELADEDSTEFASLLLSDGWILGDLPDLPV